MKRVAVAACALLSSVVFAAPAVPDGYVRVADLDGAPLYMDTGSIQVATSGDNEVSGNLVRVSRSGSINRVALMATTMLACENGGGRMVMVGGDPRAPEVAEWVWKRRGNVFTSGGGAMSAKSVKLLCAGGAKVERGRAALRRLQENDPDMNTNFFPCCRLGTEVR